MLEFYNFSRGVRLLMSFQGALVIIAQSVNIVLSSRRFDWQNYRIRILYEYFFLANLFVLAAIVPILNYRIRDGVVFGEVMILPRLIGYALLAAITLMRIVSGNKPIVVTNLLIALPLQPFMPEFFHGSFFVWLTLALMYWLIRGIYMSLENREMLRRHISVWSIKEAMDTLHSGILFCTKDGAILLLNKKMQQLMLSITSKIHHDGLAFFGELERLTGEEPLIVSLPDKTHWRFGKSLLQIGWKQYYQISATEVTEQWNLVSELRARDMVLREKSDELRGMINNMYQIQREQEQNRLKARLHDLLSQRITVFQRWMQSNEYPASDKILDLIRTLESGIQIQFDEYRDESLRDILKPFYEIGIKIRIEGNEPEGERDARIFGKIVREAATNAVRHGLAKEIDILFSEDGKNYGLEIRNDGVTPEGELRRGNGLLIMEERLKKVGGSFRVDIDGAFTIRATIPKEK